MTKKLFRSEGIICGISSGAAVLAAMQVAAAMKTREAYRGHSPRYRERYLSTVMFDA